MFHLHHTIRSLFLLGLLSIVAPLQVSAQTSVLTQHNDNARTGANLQETVLTPSNVNVNQFGLLFTRTVSSLVWSQPLYVANVAIPNKGTRNVFYVMTEIGDMYAFDADNSSETAPLWQRKLIAPPLGLEFSVGTPTIDPAAGTIFLTVKSTYNGAAQFRLHALDIKTGTDRSGSPVLIQATVPGNGPGSIGGKQSFRASSQKQRPGILLSNGYVYLGFGGSVDEFDPNALWKGWVLAYNASTLKQAAVFCVSPDANGGGIWQANNGLASDAQGNIYFSTGNGNNNPPSFNAATGGRNYGNSILKLSPASAGMGVLDWFTPWDQDFLERADQDIASCGPMLIPNTNLLVTGEKQGRLFLLNRSNMGHFRASDNSQIAQEIKGAVRGHLHGSPLYWNGPLGQHIYVWSEHDYAKAFKFNGSALSTAPVMKSTMPAPPGMPGAMLSLSANGATNGIVWANLPWQGDANQNIVPGVLRALDANDLSKELWNSQQLASRDAFGLFAKFSCPTIANGKVYLSTFSNKIGVYGLLPTTTKPGAPSNLTATGGLSRVSLNWSAASGAISYNIKRATTKGGPYTIVARSVMAPNYLDTAVVNGQTYYYVVSASNAGGESGNTNEATARPFAPAPGTVLSIDYVGGSATNGTPAAMGTTEVSGVVAVANWNAARANQGNLNGLVANGGATTGVNTSWTCLNTSSTEIAEAAGNARMMKGYLSGNNTSLTQVQVSNIPSSFTSAGYDVYVYTDGINPTATRTGDFVIGNTTLRATDELNLNYDGTFVKAGSSEVGNYVVFTNLTGSNFTLNAVPGVSTDTTPRAPLNGIQIVAHQTGSLLPGAPTNLVATAGDKRVGLSWGAAPSATTHTIWRAASASGPFNAIRAGVTGTSYADTGLTNGTMYYYQITGVNSSGNGPVSNTANARPIGPAANVLSINFVGGGPANGTPAAMGATESAGVVKAVNWNNLVGKSGTQNNLRQSSGASSTASVTWSANGTDSLKRTDIAGDARMMKGYLSTSNTSTTTVTISGLGAPYTTNTYDIYFYLDGDNVNATRSGVYQIGTTKYTGTDVTGATFNGAYALGNNRNGNYMLYANLKAASFTLTATPGTSTDGTKQAPINGIQIVAHDAPPSPPTVAVTTPANNSFVQSLTEINGTAAATGGSALRSVTVALGRKKTDNTYEYWNGSAWAAPRVAKNATLSGGSWRLSDLPTGANLVDGSYVAIATAADASQSASVMSFFTLDGLAPNINISTPTNGATLTGFTQIAGTVSEAGGLQRVDIVIRRDSDNLRWNYTTWVNQETGIATTVNGNNWARSTNLPGGSNLPNGLYYVKAVGFDKAGNVGVKEISVTINRVAAAQAINIASPVEISTVIADSTASTVELTFTGALDIATATDKTRYTLLVNGKPVPLEDALYHAASDTVTLVLTEGTLFKADEVKVSWAGLLDSEGRRIASNAEPVFVDDDGD